MNETAKKIIPWMIFVVLTAGLLIWIFLSKRVTEEEISSYEQKIADAELHVENMEYSTAMETYYDATEIIPDRVGAYEGIVEILLVKNRVDDAIDIVEKTADGITDKNKAVLYSMIGDYYYSVEDYSEALKKYEEAVNHDSKNQSANLGYGKSLLQTGEVDKAKKRFEDNLYEGDLLSEAKLILVYIESISDIEEAKDVLINNDATEKYSIHYEEMSDVLSSLNDDSKYNAAKLSRIYINNGYPYLAIKILEPLKEDISEYVEALYFLGRAYYEYGENTKAIEQLDRAALVGGLEIEIFWTEARAYIETQDLDSAIQMYDRAVAYSGESIENTLASEYVSLLIENNQLSKAETSVKSFVNYSEEAWVNFLALEVYYSLQESEKVDYYLSELSNLDLVGEDEEDYLYWKALVEIEGDLYSQAKITLAELYDLDKYNPKYYYLLGKLEFAEDNSEGAITALEKCLEYDLNYEITELASKLLSRIE